MKNLSFLIAAYLLGSMMVGGYWIYLYWRRDRPESTGIESRVHESKSD